MLHFARRRLLHLLAGAGSLTAFGAAMAGAYPSRPVRMIVGLPPGNSPDIVARAVCQWLSAKLAQPVVVENRPGAATGIAAEYVVRSPADGYTLLLVLAGNAVNGWVYKLKYDFTADIAPIASIGGIPLAMVVTPSLSAKTVPEFIAYAKAHPGRVLMGSSGNGSLPHILGAMFATMAGVELVHVPYTESVFPDLLDGQVQVAFEPVPAVIGFAKAGKLRGLAVSTRRRLAVLPALPAIDEFLPGYKATGWIGIGAPKKYPGRGHRHAQQGGQFRACRSAAQSAPGGARCRHRGDDARGFQELHRRRNREMGKGHQARQDRGAMNPQCDALAAFTP